METANRKRFEPGRGALATLVLVAMLNVMSGAAVAPALPAISEAFDASETIVSLVITLPSLAVVISGFFVGAIADRVGKARTLVVSLAVFTATGLWGVAAPTLESLLVGRFILGIAIAGIVTSSTALASEYYDESTLARVYGWQSAASGASVLILETTGGFLSLLGWHAPFWVYVVGFVLLALSALFIREAHHPSAESEQPAQSDRADESIDRTSRRAEGGIARATKIAGISVAICLAAAFISQVLSYLVPAKMPYLIDSFGESSLVSGLFLGAFGIANIAGSLASAPLQRRAQRSTIAAGCFVFISFGCILMAAASAAWMVLVGIVFIGLGVGCLTPLLVGWIASRATSRNSGRHMGAIAVAVNLGQFACTLLSGGVMAIAGTQQAVFAVAAAIGLASAAAAIALRKYIDYKLTSDDQRK